MGGKWIFRALRTHRPESGLTTNVVPKTGIAVTATDRCLARIERLRQEPALPGAPELERHRAEVLARAKAEPVLFLREPRNQDDDPEATRLRQQLLTAPYPWQAVERILKQTHKQPRLLRRILLADGYLFTDQPALAVLVSSAITLSQLFTEPELYLTRGSATYKLVRRDGNYVYADGDEHGKPAVLWLFDRVIPTSEQRTADSHVTLEAVRTKLGARAFQVERITEGALVGQFQYGNLSVPTVLKIEGNRTTFECEFVPTTAKPALEQERALAHRQQRLVERLRHAVAEQVDEALPFDEPKTEEGQQDGKLRQEWRTAYAQGQNSFTFNGDRYQVFDPKGRAKTPQVCVDFITDSWERMSGTYYPTRGQPRVKQVGLLDFDTLGVENRRSVEKLMDFAASHPNWFELLLIPESDRVPFANRRSFFAQLATMHSDFAPGDVVTILGPRDDERLHYHSFFILADDPITGIPTSLAANAGRPRIRTWEGEMQNAPRRAIIGRIRPTLAWLEAVTGLPEEEPTETQVVKAGI
jgi:hypothetical protein